MRLRWAASTLIALLFSAGPAWAQRLGGGAAPEVSLVRIFLALFACLVVASLSILFVRHRLGGRLPAFRGRIGRVADRIRLVESRRVAPGTDISLVAVDDRTYVLLLSPGGPLLLANMPTPQAATSSLAAAGERTDM